MSCFQRLQIKGAFKSKNPHITIGKRLDDEQLAIANEAIKNVSMEFCCASIALRQWNETTKHYNVIAEFPFLNQSDNDNSTQLSLL